MIYVVFEAGSRAGLSAKYLFEWYKKNHPESSNQLILVDADEVFDNIALSEDPIIEMQQDMLPLVMTGSPIAPFPADELTRQSGYCESIECLRSNIWMVKPQYFDKAFVNDCLYDESDDLCLIPRTFDRTEVFIKPNSMSAGSKGLQSLDNVCVSERIDIENEYVIDILRNDNGDAAYFGREVKLRYGYDKYIRFLPETHKVFRVAKHLVEKAHSPKNQLLSGLFNRIFHIQIAEDKQGRFWFIEASKRISGTSLVNILVGFDPFSFIPTGDVGKYKVPSEVGTDKWYRYEDLLEKVILKLRS